MLFRIGWTIDTFYPCCLEDEVETVEHAFFNCSKLCEFWTYVSGVTAHIVSEQTMCLDLESVVYNMDPLLSRKE